MNEKQAVRAYVIQRRYEAAVLLFVSVTAGLFGALLFPDFRWAVAIPGFSLCILTGWAAFVLLASASRAAELSKVREGDADAQPVDSSLTTPAESVTRINTEEQSGAVVFSTVLAFGFIILIALVTQGRHNGPDEARNPVHKLQQPNPVKQIQLPGYDLSDSEQNILLNVLVRGGKVSTDKGRTCILAIDFSSSQKIDDEVLEEYSRGVPALLELDLRNTPVTDSGVRHLANLANLRRLRLGGTRVSPEEIEALRMALPECEIDLEIAE